MGSELKQRIEDATKDAMRARDRQKLGALRLINAALKQVEIDDHWDYLSAIFQSI